MLSPCIASIAHPATSKGQSVASAHVSAVFPRYYLHFMAENGSRLHPRGCVQNGLHHSGSGKLRAAVALGFAECVQISLQLSGAGRLRAAFAPGFLGCFQTGLQRNKCRWKSAVRIRCRIHLPYTASRGLLMYERRQTPSFPNFTQTGAMFRGLCACMCPQTLPLLESIRVDLEQEQCSDDFSRVCVCPQTLLLLKSILMRNSALRAFSLPNTCPSFAPAEIVISVLVLSFPLLLQRWSLF